RVLAVASAAQVRVVRRWSSRPPAELTGAESTRIRSAGCTCDTTPRPYPDPISRSSDASTLHRLPPDKGRCVLHACSSPEGWIGGESRHRSGLGARVSQTLVSAGTTSSGSGRAWAFLSGWEKDGGERGSSDGVAVSFAGVSTRRVSATLKVDPE